MTLFAVPQKVPRTMTIRMAIAITKPVFYSRFFHSKFSCLMSVIAGARLHWTHTSYGRRLNLRDDRDWTGRACISLALESCD